MVSNQHSEGTQRPRISEDAFNRYFGRIIRDERKASATERETFLLKEFLWKVVNLEPRFLVGVCLTRMFLVTRGAPSKWKAARPPVAKRPQVRAERGPQKVWKTEGRQQAAPRDKTPRASEKHPHHVSVEEVPQKVRETEGIEQAAPQEDKTPPAYEKRPHNIRVGRLKVRKTEGREQAAPREDKTPRASAKRPHHVRVEEVPQKVRKTEGREQAAPRKDKTPRSYRKRHHHKADKVYRKVRKGEGKQKPAKTILPGEQEKQPQIVIAQPKLPRPDPQKKSVIFNNCYNRVFSLSFDGAHRDRTPTQREIIVLTQFCAKFDLPVLSCEQFKAHMGAKPRKLGKGGYGEAFLNRESGVVMKFASSINVYRTFIMEAMVTKLFAEYHSGFQRLVGLCPDKLGLVTRYAGLSLAYYVDSGRLKADHKFSILTQLCKILSDLHQQGFVHNDVKVQNVCVSLT
ncbi:uncharacterized protein [Penaeus vannamei]|uniref:uncharacterized protein n=1 Tax=Penaeus vannamei TaxID=6689 RepID=UPI00387FAB37